PLVIRTMLLFPLVQFSRLIAKELGFDHRLIPSVTLGLFLSSLNPTLSLQQIGNKALAEESSLLRQLTRTFLWHGFDQGPKDGIDGLGGRKNGSNVRIEDHGTASAL